VQRVDEIHVIQRRFALLDQDALLTEHLPAVAIERPGVQPFRRAERVGAVHDDDIHAARRRRLHPFDAVAEHEPRPRVIVRDTQLGKKLLRQPGNAFVDFHLQDPGDPAVFQYFPQRPAIAATDDHHLFRGGMGEQGRM